MDNKLIINQEHLQELKTQNNKLKSLVSEYFEITINKYSEHPYLRKEQLKKEIIKLLTNENK